jgi:iron(III) transport system substrate-binding protein
MSSGYWLKNHGDLITEKAFMVIRAKRLKKQSGLSARHWAEWDHSLRFSETALFLIILLICQSAMSFGADDRTLDAAQREGRAVWYTVAGESQELARSFEKKYPFVRVEVIRSTVFPLLSRMLNEAKAGSQYYDVVRQSAFATQTLIQKGMIQPYDSPERKFYNQEAKDKLGYWTSTDENYFVIAYNTKMVSSGDAPKDWDDLLNPKWRGKIAMDPDNHVLYGGLEKIRGKEKSEEYFKKLSRQEVQFRKGNTLLAQLIVAGEYPLGFVYAHRVELLKAQGAPIEWVSTMNPIVTTLGPVGLAANPQHPNAGKLLIDFLLSMDAQRQLQKMYRIPSRSNLEPVSRLLDANRLKLAPLPPSLADKEESWKNFFKSTFQLPG